MFIPLPRGSLYEGEEGCAIHRRFVALFVGARLQERNISVEFPLTVEMVRVAPEYMDYYALRPALKAVRSGIADALGVDASDTKVTWHCLQAKHPTSLAQGISVAIYP